MTESRQVLPRRLPSLAPGPELAGPLARVELARVELAPVDRSRVGPADPHHLAALRDRLDARAGR